MKKLMTVVLVVGLMIVITGIVGSIFSNNNFDTRFNNESENYFNRGMMYNEYYTDDSKQNAIFDADEECFESYHTQYEENSFRSCRDWD